MFEESSGVSHVVSPSVCKLIFLCFLTVVLSCGMGNVYLETFLDVRIPVTRVSFDVSSECMQAGGS